MPDIYAYQLKLFVATALLYAAYKLITNNNTFFKIRRFVLMFMLAFSASFSFINIQFPGTVLNQNLVNDFAIVLPELLIDNPDTISNRNVSLIAIIYLVVSIALMLRFFAGIASIVYIKRGAAIKEVLNTRILIPKKQTGPFSFFNMVFINPAIYDEKQLHEIITHENTHKNQLHTLDVIISELFCVIFWFNPFIWLIKREIRINLEHLADESVISSVSEPTQYQYNLLRLGYIDNKNKLVNHYNVSQLKKRIKIMNIEKSNRKSILRYLLILPLTAFLIIACSENTNDDLLTVKKQSPTSLKTAIDDTFTVVEDMPKFPGGEKELMNFLTSNLKYPRKAMEDSIQGRVICSFIIEKDGSVVEPNIIRGVTTELDEAALEIISKMPKWEPGRQRGEAVRVKYTLPVNFRLK